MDNKAIILNDVIGFFDIYNPKIKDVLINNFNDIENKYQEYKEVFQDDYLILKDIYECYDEVNNLYNAIILKTINEFFDNTYNHSADFVFMKYSQENITLKLEKYLQIKGYSQEFKSDIYTNIKLLAKRFNKRFCFDKITLINLIEASMKRNIITEDLAMKDENKIYETNNGKFT